MLAKNKGTLVVKASDRDTVLNEISAQQARYKRIDPVLAEELGELRNNVRDIFNKGQTPSDDIMEALYFLDPQTRDLVEKMTKSYDMVVTPDDFRKIAGIMSEYLGEQVPILKDFTKFFGRLAEAFLTEAKPSNSAWDWKTILEMSIRGSRKKGYVLPDGVSRMFGLKAGEPVPEKVLKRLRFYIPGSNLADMLLGVKAKDNRRTGGKFFSLKFPGTDLIDEVLGKGNPISKKLPDIVKIKIGQADKLPKSWTNVPWVNFDGKTIEQNFTQSFEERLAYKNAEGKWTNNILHISQKTEATWWDQILNESGKINDIADVTKARTAFAVNGGYAVLKLR